MFSSYFELGLDHILDLKGYDHILFVVAMSIGYAFKEWKVLTILVTAFTLGHCLTLLLASLNIIRIPSDIVELMIPITIFLTAIDNIINFNRNYNLKEKKFKYGLIALFGLVHGLGFSNFFKQLLSKEDSIVSLLIPFNIGVEIGQLCIVFGTLLLTWILSKIGLSKQLIVQLISTVIAFISVYLVFVLLNIL